MHARTIRDAAFLGIPQQDVKPVASTLVVMTSSTKPDAGEPDASSANVEEATPKRSNPIKRFFAMLGPGLITGASDAGVLTGNDKLRAEGKTDQAVGEVKQLAERVVDKVKKAVQKTVDD